MADRGSPTMSPVGKLAGWRQLAVRGRQLYAMGCKGFHEVGGLAAENRVPPSPGQASTEVIVVAQSQWLHGVESGGESHRSRVSWSVGRGRHNVGEAEAGGPPRRGLSRRGAA